MHSAKHRAAGSATAAVLATTLIERCTVVPAARPGSTGPTEGRPAPSRSRHGRHTHAAAEVDGSPARTGLGDTGLGDTGLGGAMPSTAATSVVSDGDDRPSTASWFGGADGAGSVPFDDHDDSGTPPPGDSPLFGAARHARSRDGVVVPGPRVSGTFPGLRAVRSQPVGTAISATVLGAAAAVTAVVVPAPSAVETTGSMLPVHESGSAPAPVSPIGPALAAPAPHALPDQPTVQIPDLVNGIRAQMAKAAPAAVPAPAPAAAPYTTVANATALSAAPSAMMRRAALTTALGRLGKPYRWGAMGPNAFDCSGLVKWSFANVGRSLPRTSRAMAQMGVAVARRDLQPGDLVFFYQPISHVGIYLGDNKIVHASQTGQPVKISDITYMRFTAARRIA